MRPFDSRCKCTIMENDPYKYYSTNAEGDSTVAITCCTSTRNKILNLSPPGEEENTASDYLSRSFDDTPCEGFYGIKENPNCFTTTANSKEITVKMTDSITGNYVTFSGAESVGGIPATELNTSFKITFVDDKTVTIQSSTPATSSVTGGGENIKAIFQNSDNNLIRLKAQTVLEYTLLSNFTSPTIERNGTDIKISCASPNNAYILQFPGYSENVTLPVCLDSSDSKWDPNDTTATLPISYYYPTTLTYPVSMNLQDIKTSDSAVSNGVIDFTLYNDKTDKNVIIIDYDEYMGEWGKPDWISKLGDPVYKSKGNIQGEPVKKWDWIIYLILFVAIILVMGGYYFIEHNKFRIRHHYMNKMKKGSGDRAAKRIMENS